VSSRIGVEQHVDVGMARLELSDPPDKPRRRERGAGVDDEEAAPLRLAHRAGRARQHREAVAEARRARRARLGQAQAAAGTLDQRRADFLFEQADLLRDRRLGDEKLLGGARER
jgi:hypothetical protein